MVSHCVAMCSRPMANPICRVLGIAPSTFYAHKAVERDPDLGSARAKRDKSDEAAIKRVHGASGGRYGARKVWQGCRRLLSPKPTVMFV